MEIEFDTGKDEVNIAKHGVSLALTGSIEWSDVLCVPDSRRIGLRKANSREVELYDEAN